MSKLIINFTPVSDILLEKYGPYVAYVFGAIWIECRNQDGKCRLNQAVIATNAHVSRGTVNNAIKVLVRDGYLIDITPKATFGPHTYKDAGLSGIVIDLGGSV